MGISKKSVKSPVAYIHRKIQSKGIKIRKKDDVNFLDIFRFISFRKLSNRQLGRVFERALFKIFLIEFLKLESINLFVLIHDQNVKPGVLSS